jgi:hypothetical protein
MQFSNEELRTSTMSFNESNTVEQMILNAVENLGRTAAVEPMHDAPDSGACLASVDFEWFAESKHVPRHR